MDVNKIREDFPLLKNRDIIYLDNAATSQKPACVLDAEKRFYEKYNANPFRGLYELSEEATECYEDARKTVTDFLHASCPEEIVFTRNATESLNLAAYTLSEYLLKPGDEIIVSIMEHHSNILPWQQAAKRYGAAVKYLECDMDGTIPTERLESMITDRTKIAAITQISNVLGCRNDLKTFAEICHRHGVILVGDGAQSVPHIAVDVQDLGVDFLSFSGHKMLAPMGIGALYGKKELLEKLKEGGMETPTGIMKEDWSLAAHFLAEVYEQQPDVEAFVSSLYEGTADLANNEKFNSLMDFFDVMMENNYAKDSAIAAERETTEMMLAEGQIAFMFGGNWDWSVINAYDYTENMGMMPVPQNTDDGSNEKLVGGGSKFMMIDSSDATSDEQRQAAKDFLTWLADSDEGQSFIAETCALVPAFSNNEKEVSDPLGKSVKKYADEGSLIDNYNYLPDDHLSICGATFQKYLAGQIDRAEFAAEIEDYWKNTTPVEH